MHLTNEYRSWDPCTGFDTSSRGNKLVHCMLACFYFSLKVNFKVKQLKIVLKLIPIRNHTKTDEPTK